MGARSCLFQKPGFLINISVLMPKLL